MNKKAKLAWEYLAVLALLAIFLIALIVFYDIIKDKILEGIGIVTDLFKIRR